MHSPFQPGPPPLGTLQHMTYRDFYPLQPGSVRQARYDFRHHATISNLAPKIAEDAEICLSELATNAVEHARDPRSRRWFHVSCGVLGSRRRYLRLGVHDVDGAHIPEIPSAPVDPLDVLDDESESGRGLRIVVNLATDVGVEHDPGNGKTVWCRFDLPGPSTLTRHLASLGRRASAFSAP